MPIWGEVGKENERTAEPWFQDAPAFWALIQQIWPFTKDTASSVKKVLSYGDRQPLSAENFVLYFDMIDAQLFIIDSETKEVIRVFSPSLGSKDTPDYLL